jgi:hypothetical protein
MFPKNKIEPLQLTLKSLELYEGKIDGIVGPLTLAAIKKFEALSATNTWARTDLASSGWNYEHPLSPGNGLYYARTAQGGMLRFRDQDPLNGSGTDIQSYPNDPVDTGGWDQALLSAQPFSA